jgi:hypothetical protein
MLHGSYRPLAQGIEELRALHQMCREGRVYEVERWATEGKPLQLAPEAVAKGTRPKTALRMALESGQHSLAVLLLRSGYRLDLERYEPLDLALRTRRWDLFDLLLDWGADLKSADVYTVLETYNVDLYERFRAAGYDLTVDHAVASVLGHSTSNRPLLGFVKRYRSDDPKLQQELNIALGYHVRKGNEKGVSLCLWAGADAHAPAPSLEIGTSEDDGEPEDDEDRFIGWSAVAEATLAGHLEILKRLGPNPARDDFDLLYQWARDESTVAFLTTMQAPRDLTRIVSSHVSSLALRCPGTWYRSTGTVEAILKCGVRWEETDPKKLSYVRRSLLKISDEYGLKRIVSLLARPELCAPETYHELFRTVPAQERLLSLGLVKKPITEREKQAVERERQIVEFARLMTCYDREALYEQVWSQPVLQVAKAYGVSGVRLGKVCRALQVPVPPRGYWARVRSGYTVRRPPLPTLEKPVLGRAQARLRRGNRSGKSDADEARLTTGPGFRHPLA